MNEIKWEPRFYVEMDDREEDSDYLRKQDCCVICGAYIGDLPGCYYIEKDYCPICRKEYNEKSWSDELKRLLEWHCPDEEYIKDYMNECNELGI